MKVLLLSVLAVASINADDPLCVGLPADEEVLFPSPLHCNHYYKCLNGVFTEEMCEDGLYFSTSSSRCVEAEYAECNGGSGAPEPTDSTTTPEVTSTTTPYPTTPSYPPTTTTTTPTTITTTSRTTSTTTIPTTTSTTTIPTTTTSTTTVGTPTEDPLDPRCDGDETSFWPHPNLCAYYVECYRGNSYEMACPPNKYFSNTQKKCVEAAESECCSTNAEQCF